LLSPAPVVVVDVAVDAVVTAVVVVEVVAVATAVVVEAVVVATSAVCVELVSADVVIGSVAEFVVPVGRVCVCTGLPKDLVCVPSC